MNSRAQTLILTQYPVVDQIKSSILADDDEDIEFLVISTLASGGYLGLLRQLSAQEYDRVGIFIADETSRPLVHILKVLSLVVKSKHRFVFYPDRSKSSFNQFDGLAAAAMVAFTIFFGFAVMMQNFIRALYLSLMPRCDTRDDAKIGDGSAKAGKVAYIRTNLWLGVQAGGALTHTWGVIRGLAKRNNHVYYMSADARDQDLEDSFSFIPIKPKHPYVVPRELNHFLYHRHFLKQALAKLSDFDGAIYQRMSVGNFVGVELSRQLKLPLILEYNGSESWLARNWGTPFFFKRAVALCERISLQHAHVIVTVSEPLKDELVERGVNPRRIVVHPNGVDHEVYDPDRFSDQDRRELRTRLNIPMNATVVSFVGTFGPWHGAEILSKAANQLSEAGSEDPENPLYFIFIGDGVRRPEVERNARQLVKSGRVLLTGLVDPEQVPVYLAASDILAAPTVENPDKTPFFGSPTKIFEYMASGKPTVASEIGQIAKIMEGSLSADQLDNKYKLNTGDGTKIGILVSPGQIDQLCSAILFLSKRSDLRAIWGEAARREVLEKYSWDHHVYAILKHLNLIQNWSREHRQTVLINGLHSKSGGGVTYLRNMLPLLCKDSRLDVHLTLHQSQLGLFEDYISKVSVHRTSFGGSLFQLLVHEQFYVPFLARITGAHVTFSPANYGPLVLRRSVILLRNAIGVARVERRFSKMIYWGLVYLGTLMSSLMARRAIAVSDYALRSLSMLSFDGFRRKFQVIPHGVNKIFRPGTFAERGDTSLLCVSDLYVQKNLHTLFKALPKIRNRFSDVTLKIAGAALDPQYLTRLKHLSEHENVADVVDFVGSVDVDTLQELYGSCAVFVFPSTVETFGNPLVEAMACGCPIATSNTAAMPEVAGDAAAYFNPHDADDMARVIIDLLENPDKREALGKRAVERAKMYSWEETARKTADVLIDAAQR